MPNDCPTCGRGDAFYAASHASCTDPWHADAHLRRIKAEGPTGPLLPADPAINREPLSMSTIQRRAETSRMHFEEDLRRFVTKWAPKGPIVTRDEFQRDLMMLFRGAMEHKSHVFGLHIERTESTMDALSMAATSSVRAIFKPEAEREARERRQRMFDTVREYRVPLDADIFKTTPKKED